MIVDRFEPKDDAITALTEHMKTAKPRCEYEPTGGPLFEQPVGRALRKHADPITSTDEERLAVSRFGKLRKRMVEAKAKSEQEEIKADKYLASIQALYSQQSKRIADSAVRYGAAAWYSNDPSKILEFEERPDIGQERADERLKVNPRTETAKRLLEERGGDSLPKTVTIKRPGYPTNDQIRSHMEMIGYYEGKRLLEVSPHAATSTTHIPKFESHEEMTKYHEIKHLEWLAKEGQKND